MQCCLFFNSVLIYGMKCGILFKEKPGILELAAIILYQMLWVKAVLSNGLLSDKCVSSIEGVALLHHAYKSLVVRDMFACYYHCKGDVLCQSLNFYRDSNHCELNNRTRSVRWMDSVPHRNAFYLDNPFRAFLGSSPSLPATSCQEIKNASEGLAPSGEYWLDGEENGKQPISVYCDMERGVALGCMKNPCQNGGTCEFHGEDRYTCRCLAGYNGTHCELHIDHCSSSPCFNGGTCNHMVSGFTCECGQLFLGMRCEIPQVGPECISYSINSDFDRSVLYRGLGSSYKCDRDDLVEGWYRFNGTAGSNIPTSCVPKYMCNTHAPGWLNGTLPTRDEGAVSRTVCFHWLRNCCHWSSTIQVANCSSYYVYKLVPMSVCRLRYCVTD